MDEFTRGVMAFLMINDLAMQFNMFWPNAQAFCKSRVFEVFLNFYGKLRCAHLMQLCALKGVRRKTF